MFVRTGDGWNLWALQCVGRTFSSNGTVLHASSYVWLTKESAAGKTVLPLVKYVMYSDYAMANTVPSTIFKCREFDVENRVGD